MIKFDVVKANSLTKLAEILTEKIRLGFTPLGAPSVIYLRNQLADRTALFYQPVAVIQPAAC